MTGAKITLGIIAPVLAFMAAISCALPSNQACAPQTLNTDEEISNIVTNSRLKPDDVAKSEMLPEIGKWMLEKDLTPTQWLREVYYGKTLREPINVIIIDQLANSPDEAKRRLIESCSAAGYPSREGHSSGYWGYIGGQLYEQLPEGRDDAYSNAPFVINNNHGRFFGPYNHGGTYLFIGAFSREKVAPFAAVKHEYVSFNQARDDLAENMTRKTEHKISGYVNLGNVITDDPKITTGDHDGIAVSIMAGK